MRDGLLLTQKRVSILIGPSVIWRIKYHVLELAPIYRHTLLSLNKFHCLIIGIPPEPEYSIRYRLLSPLQRNE